MSHIFMHHTVPPKFSYSCTILFCQLRLYSCTILYSRSRRPAQLHSQHQLCGEVRCGWRSATSGEPFPSAYRVVLHGTDSRACSRAAPARCIQAMACSLFATTQRCAPSPAPAVRFLTGGVTSVALPPGISILQVEVPQQFQDEAKPAQGPVDQSIPQSSWQGNGCRCHA